MATLVLVLKKTDSEDKTKYDTFYLHSKVVPVLMKKDIDDNVFKLIYTAVISNVQKALWNSCTSIARAQVMELPQSHCGDNRKGTLLSW